MAIFKKHLSTGSNHFSFIFNWGGLIMPVLEHSKIAKKGLIFQKCAKCTLTLWCPIMKSIFDYIFRLRWSLYRLNSDSTHQKWMILAFIDTCSIFLQLYWVTDNVKMMPFFRQLAINSKFNFLILNPPLKNSTTCIAILLTFVSQALWICI